MQLSLVFAGEQSSWIFGMNGSPMPGHRSVDRAGSLDIASLQAVNKELHKAHALALKGQGGADPSIKLEPAFADFGRSHVCVPIEHEVQVTCTLCGLPLA